MVKPNKPTKEYVGGMVLVTCPTTTYIYGTVKAKKAWVEVETGVPYSNRRVTMTFPYQDVVAYNAVTEEDGGWILFRDHTDVTEGAIFVDNIKDIKPSKDRPNWLVCPVNGQDIMVNQAVPDSQTRVISRRHIGGKSRKSNDADGAVNLRGNKQ